MASSGNAPEGVDPAMWGALLRWSVQQTDGTSDTPVQPMSEENKAWLEQVMKDGIVDYVKRAGEILEELTTGTKPCLEGASMDDDAVDTLLERAEELDDIVGQIDFAQSLVQIGGIAPLIGIISCDAVPAPLRAALLGVLATVAQNNPFAQEALYQAGALAIYLEALQSQETPSAMKAKALHAVSCLVRGHADLEHALLVPASSSPQARESAGGDAHTAGGVQNDTASSSATGDADATARPAAPAQGLQTLADMVSSDTLKLRRKACFLVSALASSERLELHTVRVLFNATVPSIVDLLGSETDVDARDQAIRALRTFADRGLVSELQADYGTRLVEIRDAAKASEKSAAPDDKENLSIEVSNLGELLGLMSKGS